MIRLAAVALTFVAGALLGVRLLAALYAPIDLWYTIRTAWPVALRRVLGWSAVTAVALWLVPAGAPRGALAAGLVLSLLVHLATWFAVSRLWIRTPGPPPVVE